MSEILHVHCLSEWSWLDTWCGGAFWLIKWFQSTPYRLECFANCKRLRNFGWYWKPPCLFCSLLPCDASVFFFAHLSNFCEWGYSIMHLSGDLNLSIFFLQSHENKEWVSSICNYGDDFIASIRRGNVHAVQFHPEKSGGKYPPFLFPSSWSSQNVKSLLMHMHYR